MRITGHKLQTARTCRGNGYQLHAWKDDSRAGVRHPHRRCGAQPASDRQGEMLLQAPVFWAQRPGPETAQTSLKLASSLCSWDNQFFMSSTEDFSLLAVRTVPGVHPPRRSDVHSCQKFSQKPHLNFLWLTSFLPKLKDPFKPKKRQICYIKLNYYIKGNFAF